MGGGELLGEVLGDRGFEAALGVDQQRQLQRLRSCGRRARVLRRCQRVFVGSGGVRDLRRHGIERGERGDGELRGAGVSGEHRGGDGVTVNGATHGDAQRRVRERGVGGVEAEEQHGGGGRVGQIHAAEGSGGGLAEQIGGQQMRAARGEEVDGGIGVLGAGELDALKHGRRVAPPVFAAHEARPLAVGQKQIRPGAQRHGVFLGAGFDDWNVQQRGKRAVRLAQRDGERAAPCAHGGDVGEPRGEAVRDLGAAVGREHVGGRERRAVGKGDAVAQLKGVGQVIAAATVGRAEQGLRLKTLVEHEQALVEQGADHLLHPVRTGDGVKRLAAEIGERKDLRGGGGFLRLAGLLRRVCPEVIFLRNLRFVAAGKGEAERECTQKRRQPFHISSSSAMTAICPPRRAPSLRCDQ